MTSQRGGGTAAQAASVLLVTTLLLAPGGPPLYGTTTDAPNSVLLVEARRGKVAQPPDDTAPDPRTGHTTGGVDPQPVGGIGLDVNASMLPVNFTDRLAGRGLSRLPEGWHSYLTRLQSKKKHSTDDCRVWVRVTQAPPGSE